MHEARTLWDLERHFVELAGRCLGTGRKWQERRMKR